MSSPNSKKAKTEVSSAVATFENAIAAANKTCELEELQKELVKLTETVNSKIAGAKQVAKEKGLKYGGEDAVKCPCGNTVDPEGNYTVHCNSCDTVKCSDCSNECHICGESQCTKCLSNCDSCEKEYCKMCSFGCQQCGVDFCSECSKAVGYGGDAVCTGCADEILCPTWA